MTNFISARWGDSANSVIVAIDEHGQSVCIPTDPANNDFRRIIEGVPDEGPRTGLAPIPVMPFDAAEEAL